MNKFVIEVSEGQQLTAGTKAKEDIVNILMQDGYKKISVAVPENKVKRGILGSVYWGKALKKVNDGDIIIYQYPAYSRILSDYFIKAINRKKNIRKIVVIHDLDSIRLYGDRPKDIERELMFFEEFDAIICHNQAMSKWLVDSGCTTQIVVLGIFDYLEQLPINESKDYKTIIFAGNLEKSKFLEKIQIQTKFNLYGINPKESYPSNFNYKGAFRPDELGKHLEGGFGLVWDGDSIESCTGIYGEYMKFNNPHKTSLYIAMGYPVIIWKEAALATFIEKEQLGFTISSLSEIDEIIKNITFEEYKAIKVNTIKMAKKLRSGFFIKKAIEEAINV